jgi:prolipoprotein diacylglyceryl transferase
VTVLSTLPLSIPSPAEGVWNLGPLPLRGYAISIILGIIAAVWIGERRWQHRGGRSGEVSDIAIWAVLFGIVGARLYHVATDWDLYFGAHARELGNSPIDALAVWNGGLGIWGGIAAGALGVMIGCRLKGIKVLPMLDTLAPGVLVAQAIGRWGNWWNQELFGGPTTLPWGLEISPSHRPAGYEQYATFHPTFLYECLWNLAAFGLLIWLAHRYRIGHGRVMALYVMVYTAGRAWIENMRIDTVQMDDVFGLRLNVWTSIVLFVAAAIYFVVSLRTRPGREESIYQPGRGPADEAGSVGDDAADEQPEEAQQDEGSEEAVEDRATERP